MLEHRDGSHHFVLQLEHEGTLKTWVLPRGLPVFRGDRRLALQAPDVPLSSSEALAPAAAGPGAHGTTTRWDAGFYKPRAWSRRSIVFTLHGRRRDGTFALVRFDRAGPAAWLVLPTGSAGRLPR